MIIERIWKVLGGLGAVRLLVLLVVFGAAYLIMCNTAGRVIGALMLGGVAVWIWKTDHDFRNPKSANQGHGWDRQLR